MNHKIRLIYAMLFHCLLAAGSCFTFVCYAEEKTFPLAISVNHDNYVDYLHFVNGRDIASINYYGGEGARRDVIEIVLLQQALLLGGFTDALELRDEQNYLRTLRQIADGELISSGALVWYSDILNLPDYFHISQTIVNDGEFVVGFYTSSTNTKALAAQSLEQLQELRAVTSTQWQSDVDTLQNLHMKNLYFTSDWVQMVRMIKAHRADITLAPFQATQGMKIQVDGMELVPIEGIKVSLAGSRHWPISRKHPRGTEYYLALQKGIDILKQRGTIKRAYEESGFFHQRVKEWKVIDAF